MIKINSATITNVGLIVFFGNLIVEKLFAPPNFITVNYIYAIGGLLVLIGTIMYFMRKR